MAITEGLQVESEQFAALFFTRDLTEGINAWIERRPPVVYRPLNDQCHHTPLHPTD